MKKMERINGVTEGEFEKGEMKKCMEQVSHVALDIGGSLIKMVYFCNHCSVHERGILSSKEGCGCSNGNANCSLLKGKLFFLKFETSKINECLEFLSTNEFQLYGGSCHWACACNQNVIKATGGGAFKFTELFKEKLGVTLDKVDEMDSLVAGTNFLLKAASGEAFTYMNDQKEFVQIAQKDLYPYLLVNIGSGVSMIKVDGEGKFERVSGTSIGGGTFWGLGKLLTKCKSFDELLELSHSGNNRVIDMLVGDIYDGMDYPKDKNH
ncbi:hypothetical protein ACH5RR_035629 [Cinchona calisaya]|uniref:Pantothenate kinase n=1 Tax=Cinchona calisaya TaxID=153742 RepID=A0ABD2Y4S9_9GENT